MQFTANAFTSVLQAAGVRISMDGKGAWRDNFFIERFWWSLKHEEVYLRAYDSVWDARQHIGAYLDYYNSERPHTSLQGSANREPNHLSKPVHALRMLRKAQTTHLGVCGSTFDH